MTPRANGPPDILMLDEMSSPAIASALVDRGIDCQAMVANPMLRSLDDYAVLEAALGEGRILVTNNVVDFEVIRRRREAEGQISPGLIYTSDDRFPRNRAFSARLADALENAARRHLVCANGGVLWLAAAIEDQVTP